MKILFSGCSFITGEALEDPSACVANVVAKQLDADVTNIAISGNTNDGIFLDTLTEIVKNSYDHVFVGFTSWPRWGFAPELDMYPTRRFFTAGHYPTWLDDLDSNEGIKIKHKQELYDALMLINHDWHNVMQVVKYVNILATYPNVTFINSLCQWDTGFFEQFKLFENQVVIPSELTPYTRYLLNVNNRDDEQINQLLQKNIISEFNKIGHIHTNRWVNLYNPWSRNKIDVATDGSHPGAKAHKWMADKITHFSIQKG
jgi:hypothetical protein